MSYPSNVSESAERSEFNAEEESRNVGSEPVEPDILAHYAMQIVMFSSTQNAL